MAASQVFARFGLTSLAMWALPVFVLFAFNNNWLPGVSDLSTETHTLLSGFLAVLTVNVVIGFYIYLALKDPPTASAPQPDPAYEARTRASLGSPSSTRTPSLQAEGDKKTD